MCMSPSLQSREPPCDLSSRLCLASLADGSAAAKAAARAGTRKGRTRQCDRMMAGSKGVRGGSKQASRIGGGRAGWDGRDIKRACGVAGIERRHRQQKGREEDFLADCPTCSGPNPCISDSSAAMISVGSQQAFDDGGRCSGVLEVHDDIAGGWRCLCEIFHLPGPPPSAVSMTCLAWCLLRASGYGDLSRSSLGVHGTSNRTASR